jgi:Fe-S-cluster containining protein
MPTQKKTPWYVAGLYFECMQCGECCAGPAAGYIWITRGEIKLIADFLKITTAELRRKFLRRVGLRSSIIENCVTRDCIFLNRGLHGEQKRCTIYPIRPQQCRDWPFWSENLKTPDTWNQTARRCPGTNRGRFYSYDEIEKIGYHVGYPTVVRKK